LTGLIGLFALLSLSAAIFPPQIARWIIVPLIVLWGFVGFSFPSAQQAYIVTLAPKLAPITLSLNSSAIYLGASLGAVLGSLVVAHQSVADLGWLAAVCEILSLALFVWVPRRRRAATGDPVPVPAERVAESHV